MDCNKKPVNNFEKQEFNSNYKFCCGYTEKGAVFYDAKYCTYYYPENGKYKFYDGLFNHPVIINRINVINVSEGDDGIGIINSFGEQILDNVFDEIKIELKITASKGNSVSKKIISFSNNVFKKGDVSNPEEWI